MRGVASIYSSLLVEPAVHCRAFHVRVLYRKCRSSRFRSSGYMSVPFVRYSYAGGCTRHRLFRPSYVECTNEMRGTQVLVQADIMLYA